jgi:hypothetical protein
MLGRQKTMALLVYGYIVEAEDAKNPQQDPRREEGSASKTLV